MDPVRLVRDEGGVATLELQAGRGNPLGREAVEALAAAAHRLREAPPAALVLAARGGVFCGGFDLGLVAHLERQPLAAFFRRFMEALGDLLLLPAPVVAALDGHAVGAGCFLALAADFRHARPGVRIGLPEVQLGVAVPAGMQVLLRERVGPRHARRLCLEGELVDAEEALAIGLVDVLAPDARASALERAGRLASLPGRGAGETRALLAGRLHAAIEEAEREAFERFLDGWFSEPAQAALRARAAALGRR